jgi:hypothetical protein
LDKQPKKLKKGHAALFTEMSTGRQASYVTP